MRSLKVGYWPISKNLDAAGDRRRLVFWAKNRGHEIITDITQKVDVIVASENADFRSKIFSGTKTPIVFDLIDSYLGAKSPIDDLVRGSLKRLDSQISSGFQYFTNYIKEFCTISNIVVCSSPEQEIMIKEFNTNTHVILDSHEELPFADIDFRIRTSRGQIKTILWEGQPATIPGISHIGLVLKSVANNNNLEFSFVTDKEYFRVLNKYFKGKTINLIQKVSGLNDDQFSVTKWSPRELILKSEASYFSIIPIDLTVPLIRFKPENRLLIMWRLGLPCLTSASPAYVRVAKKAGVNAICESPSQWRFKMQQLLDDPELAQTESLKGQAYVREHHSESLLLKKWDEAIESAMSS